MGYKDYNILIVDDDKAMGETLKRVVTRMGFRCHVSQDAQDALSYAQLQDFHMILVDCMLPQMNGLELVQKLEERVSGEPVIFLMSGIFNDQQFIKTSMAKTGAKDFLVKPFDLKSFEERLESLFSGVKDEVDFHSLMGLYMNREIEERKLIKVLNNCEGLHNFDLPWVLKMLREVKATGHLNIACTNGDIAGVGFDQGLVVQVHIKNEISLLGLLLVEQGYLDRMDLGQALEANTNNKMIGKFLVESNYVSPHSINIVLKEQLTWRLKRLMVDSQIEINFVKSKDVSTVVTITDSDFESLLMDVVEDAIGGDWLKAHYLPLSHNSMKINSDKTQEIKRIQVYPFVSKTFSLIEGPLKKGTSIGEMVATNPASEENILRLIHFFNIMGFLSISHAHKTLDFGHQTKRLKKLEQELEVKNHFERLGLSPTAKETDIKRAYFELAKVLHPDKLDPSTPVKVKELSQKVFDKIQVAYDSLKKEDKRKEYLHQLELEQSDRCMQGDQILDRVRELMDRGHFSQAGKLLKEAIALNPQSPEIQIYSYWLEMKLVKQPTPSFLSLMGQRLNKIPVEARDTPPYYHCRGLYYALMNDREKSRKYFNTALGLDSAFISARRELNSLGQKKEKVTSILHADLKDVVGALFKR